MSDFRVGRAARALRHRLHWRQVDVARKAGVSQARVSRVERGQIDGLTVATLQRIFSALDAELVNIVRWRGGELDRLLDEGHAFVVGRVSAFLGSRGWETRVEVSFAVYGERGSIDLLAWHPTTPALLVIEVKTEITSIEETLRKHDMKSRLAAGLAAERFGWRARVVGRLLALPDTTTARRRVSRHEAIFSHAYPLRGDRLRRWLRRPDSPAAALLFAPASRGAAGVRSPTARRRVVVLRPSTDRHKERSRVATDRPHQSPGD